MKNFKFISIVVFSITLIISGFLISVNDVFAASPTLSAKEFTIWNNGGIIGYDAGFTLSSGATFSGSQSIVIKLYSGNILLQTNTAIAGKIKGTGFLTPFDIFGTFDYIKDGYFTNVRESEYGRILTPTKVVATVVLSDGNIITATNTYLVTKEGCFQDYLFSSITGEDCPSGQVLGANSFKFISSLKVGSKGNEVVELQKFLNNSGYNSGVADGIFGLITKNALVNFQIANGLDDVGVVGPKTRAILNK